MRHITTTIALFVIVCASTAEAQLFKGKANRQSGGGNSFNNNSQRSSGGGLFSKGRERREANQSQSYSPQYSNGSSTRTGLFGNEKPAKQGLFGNRQNQASNNSSNTKSGGLFWKAKERRAAEQAQSYSQNRSYNGNNNYSQNYSNSPSQTNSSFVRSTQKVTSASALFNNNSTAATSLSNPSAISPSPAPQSVASKAISLTRVDSQTPRAELPAIVNAGSINKRQPPKPVTPAGKAPRVAERPKPTSAFNGIMGSKLKEAAPSQPNAKPTANLPKSDAPKVEIAVAVLA